MKSFRMTFQCAGGVIVQDDCTIRHPGLPLEYSSKTLPLDEVYDR